MTGSTLKILLALVLTCSAFSCGSLTIFGGLNAIEEINTTNPYPNDPTMYASRPYSWSDEAKTIPAIMVTLFAVAAIWCIALKKCWNNPEKDGITIANRGLLWLIGGFVFPFILVCGYNVATFRLGP